jgi:AraC-like DNA-binding protein
MKPDVLNTAAQTVPEWFVEKWAETALHAGGVYLANANKGSKHRSGQRDMWSFRAVLHGVLRLRQGAWTADLEAGDQTLLLPDSAFTHEVMSNTCEFVAIDFRIQSTGFGADPLPTLSLPAVVHVPPSGKWMRTLQEALDAMKGGFDVFEGRGAVDTILGLHLKRGITKGEISVAPQVNVPPWLSTVHKDIKGSFWRQNANPAEMAAQSGFSRSHFNRAFREAYGISPMRFLWEHRLQIAARKLDSDPSLAIGGIAHNCGFKSHTHFTRMFRRRFGLAPLAWRRRERVKTNNR